MLTRSLGTSGPAVSAIGLGCMGMSDLYGPADEQESVAVLHAAMDAGITLLDTSAVEALRAVASSKGATVAQLAIAWVLSRGGDIVPLVGARRRDRLREALGALTLALGPEDLAAIEAALPPSAIAGTRYDEHQMRMLDSERA